MFNNNRRNLFLTLLLYRAVVSVAVFLGGALVFRCPAAVPSTSEVRLKALNKLVKEATEGLSPEGVIQARRRIIDGFRQLFPECDLYPATPPVDEATCLRAARRTADEAMKKAYPSLDEKKIEEEAARRYPAYKVGDVVTLVYQASPVRQVKVSGIYRGKTPDAIVIGGSKVLMQDIAAMEGGDEVLAKFDAERCARLRREYIEKKKQTYLKARQAAWQRVYQRAIEEEKRLGRLQNELHGYVLYKGKWRRVPDVVSDLLLVERRRRLALAAAKAKQAATLSREAAPAAPQTGAAPVGAPEEAEEAGGGAPPAHEKGAETVEPVLPKVGPAEPNKEKTPESAAVAAPGGEGQETKKPEATPGAEAESKAEGKSATSGAETRPTPEAPDEDVSVEAVASEQDAAKGVPDIGTAPGEIAVSVASGTKGEGAESAGATAVEEAPLAMEDQGVGGEPTGPPPFSIWLAVIGGLVGFGVIVAAILAALNRRPQGTFYTSREDAEERFWAEVEADADRFKHAAFLFPTEEDARAALSALSYIMIGSKPGQFCCGPAVHFGVYPEERRYVAFVGGPALSRSMWREAVDKWSEAEGAVEFRVSTPPDRQAVVPDPETLSGKAAEVVVAEEREGEAGDYSHYYTFHAPDRESAMAFLKKVVVPAPGEYVIVETPEGHWGKDHRGTYRE
ncbi:MAG: hypothetical protein GXP31_10650 [Kiritimatiellaeota bacterium]|nr:hypothetical protein [Kiritimatiellota bacterium]